MQGWKFDDLTRSLGAATSRRQVLKGLLGGVAAAVVGRSVNVKTVSAADGVCSSSALAQCYADAKAQYDLDIQACGAQPGEPDGGKIGAVIDFACKVHFDRKYFNALQACDIQQCPHGGMCVNDHCCQGSHCCDPGIQCPPNSQFGTFPGDPPAFCCAEGESCCHDSCCAAGNTCCMHVDHGLPFGLRSPSWSYTCSDLSSDRKNCGACDNDCGDLDCVDGQCQCPAETTICSGLFNKTCCQPDERCMVNPITFGVSCDPICSPCEVYSPNDPNGPCIPRDCGTCKSCDPASGQCIAADNGTECGSGLSCCGGSCVNTTCQGNQTFNPDTCACECPPVTCPDGQTQDPVTCKCTGSGGGSGGCPPCQSLGDNGCAPDPTMDGDACGSCGTCSGGYCVADGNKTCPACSTCSNDGNCIPQPDNTVCGSNEVCCNGVCTSGQTCGPCPDGPNGHQCPQDAFGNQICCYGDLPCCAADNGEAMCGPSNGVCCTVGSQISCGTTCCDAATEHCGYDGNGDGHCCPLDQYVTSDGTCCPSDQYCIVNGSSICCPSGKQCASDPEQTVSICCDTSYADSDGNCCAAGFVYASCADGAYICCGASASADTCCAGHGGAA